MISNPAGYSLDLTISLVLMHSQLNDKTSHIVTKTYTYTNNNAAITLQQNGRYLPVYCAGVLSDNTVQKALWWNYFGNFY